MRSRETREDERHQRLALSLCALFALLYTAGIFLPVLLQRGAPATDWVRLAYSPMCHQLPGRSLHVDGVLLAVCSRCTGLYLGGAAGLSLAAWFVVGGRNRPRGIVFLLAVAPTIVDAVLPWIGLRGLTDLPRMLLAIPAGFVAAWFLAVGIADLFAGGRRRPVVSGPASAGRRVEVLDA